MLASKVTSLVLAALAGSPAVSMQRGKLGVKDGHKAIAVYLKCSIPVANASGGAVTLTDAQKQTLLDCFQITVDMGPEGGTQQPYIAHGLSRIQREARRFYASEIEGYTDATTGLGQSLPNAATTTVVFYLPIPTGRAWFLEDRFKDLWGMGPMQAKQFGISLRCVSTAVLAGVTLSGNCTFDVLPDVVPAKRETWSPLAQFITKSEQDKTLDMPPGLYFALAELTYKQASAVSTNVTLSVDDEVLYDQMSAADVAVSQADAARQPAAGQTTDRETLFLSQTEGERPLERLFIGAPKLVQNVHDLATFAAGASYIPILAEDKLDKALLDMATKEGKPLKAINAAVADGWAVPHRLLPYMPMYVVKQDDALWEQFSGRVAQPGALATTIESPPQVVAAVKALRSHAASGGRALSAANIERQFAASVPGVVQSSKGFDTNVTPTFNRLRAQLN